MNARCELAVGASRLAVGWQSPAGPALSVVRRGTSKARTQILGGEVATRFAPPEVSYGREADPYVSFVDDRGAWVARAAETPILLAPQAHAASHVLHRGRSSLAFADEDGLALVHDVRARSTPERLLRRSDVSGPLRAVYVPRSGFLIVYGVAGGGQLGVCFAPEGGGAPRDVRHRLSAPVETLRAVAVGGRVALALELAQGPCQLAVMDREGGMRERPYEVLPSLREEQHSPHLIWVQDEYRFVMGAGDDLVLTSLWDAGAPPVRLSHVGAPMAAAYRRGRLWVAHVHEPTPEELAAGNGERALLRVTSCDVRGDARSDVVIDATPENLPALRRATVARRVVRALEERLARTGYRGAALRSSTAPGELERETAEGGRLRMRDVAGPGVWNVELRPTDDGFELRFERRADLGESSRASLWTRLRRAVRGLPVDVEGTRAMRELLGDAGQVVSVRFDEGGRAMQAALVRPPAAGELERWLRAFAEMPGSEP